MSDTEPERSLAREQYAALANFRFELRRFLAFSEAVAAREGLPPQQHQALLAIAGRLEDEPTTVGYLAEQLLIAPHTAAELVSGDPAVLGKPTVYSITAPTPVGTSTYPLTITNVPGGVDTLVQPKPPVGKLEIKAKWRVAKGMLTEDVEIEGNFMTKR